LLGRRPRAGLAAPAGAARRPIRPTLAAAFPPARRRRSSDRSLPSIATALPPACSVPHPPPQLLELKFSQKYKTVQRAFITMDMDGDSFINLREFRQCLEFMGIYLTGTEFRKLWRQFDVSGDGKVSRAARGRLRGAAPERRAQRGGAGLRGERFAKWSWPFGGSRVFGQSCARRTHAAAESGLLSPAVDARAAAAAARRRAPSLLAPA